MSRREEFRLVNGQGRYTADWGLPGELHAVFPRAGRAHADIVQLDAGRALALPGVKAVLAGDDVRAAGFKSPANVVGYTGRNGQQMLKHLFSMLASAGCGSSASPSRRSSPRPRASIGSTCPSATVACGRPSMMPCWGKREP